METLPADIIFAIFDTQCLVTITKLCSLSKYFMNMSIKPLLEKIKKEQGALKCITEIFLSINENKIIYADKTFIFNKRTTLYEEISRNCLIEVFRFLQSLSGMLCIIKQNNNNIIMGRKILIVNHLSQSSLAYGIIDKVKANIHDITKNNDIFAKNINENSDVANFKNGMVCLKTGQFSKRTHNDHYTRCLNYDYTEIPDIQLLNKINQILLQLCNNDEECCTMIKEWLGYCLTGNIDARKVLFISDDESLDGVRLIIKIFFEMYMTWTYSNHLINMSGLGTCPVRYTEYYKHNRFFLVDRENMIDLDPIMLKKWTNGDIFIRQSYDMDQVQINKSKLTILNFNYNLRNQSMNTVIDRGFVITPDNVNQTDIMPLTKVQYIFNDMRQNDHKLALFHILLPYSIQYYQQGLLNYHKFENKWKQICLEK